jgi:formylglycine-generating enzyme required for sulfatase activity
MSGRIKIPAVVPDPPAWAGGFGVDCHGVFAELVLGEVTQVLRWIPPGEFTMGSPADEAGRWEDEGPRHQVVIRQGFWLGETPVTQAFHVAVTDRDPSGFKGGERPVETVSWDDAQVFCQKLTALLPLGQQDRVRLPSEAEWEYAGRAGTDSALYSGKALMGETGACPNLAELAWHSGNSDRGTHPVKGKLPNAWGLHDMLGNVWEWCQDEWHDTYAGAPADGSVWEDGGEEGRGRVIRGGGWGISAGYCRCAYRGRSGPADRGRFLGFRLVLAPSSVQDPDHSLEF